MENFFLEYRDPLSSLIIFFLLILIVSLSSYWLGIFKSKDKDSSITSFLDKLSSYSDRDFLYLLENTKDRKILINLAKCFLKNGEHDKAIDTYLHILNQNLQLKEKIEILTLLGDTYFRVGFLQKAKDTFLNVLKTYPRNIYSLKKLLIINEKMLDFKSAYETLEPLEELGIDIQKERAYLKTKLIKNRDKIDELLYIHREIYKIDRLLIEYLINKDIDKLYENLELFDVKNSIDLFWHLDESKINFDIIKTHKILTSVFSAKGFNLKNSSEIFELAILIDLNSFNNNQTDATLDFKYECKSCFEIFPFYFDRCPNCLNLFEFDLKLSIKKKNEKNKTIL